jgi:hypothetical protein
MGGANERPVASERAGQGRMEVFPPQRLQMLPNTCKAGCAVVALGFYYHLGFAGGETARPLLQVAGDHDRIRDELCELLGTEDCSSRLRYEPAARTIMAELGEIDTSSNEGALLLRQISGSGRIYNLTLGNRYLSAAGPESLDGVALINNSNSFDPPRFPYDKPSSVRPPAGVDSLVAIDPAVARYVDSEGRRVPLSMIVFHELAEAYAKVDHGKPYIDFEIGSLAKGLIGQTPVDFQRGAHNDAVQRELVLREQRPALQSAGRAGDVLTRAP